MNTEHSDVSRGNILVVDDTPANLRLLAGILTDHGYAVRPVPNGKLALWGARGTMPSDLILLDIVMPDMDGYEVCQQLKADERTRDIPVIFLSALDDVSDKIRAFSVGGVDYITKPFQEEEVLARVRAHLMLRTLQKAIEERNAQLEEKNVQLEEKNVQLEEAIANVRTLRGLLPICAGCKKIRDDKGYWNQIEAYVESHSDARFSHGICEECADRLYGDQEWYRKSRTT